MATSDVSPDIQSGAFADVMPEMSEDEFDALKRSIERNGFDETTPIIVDSDGEIIDGHHRYRACQELDVEPVVTVAQEPTVEQAYRANLARRNLEGGKKREIVESYLEEHWDGDRPQSDIAADLGVSEPTVSRAVSNLSAERLSSEQRALKERLEDVEGLGSSGAATIARGFDDEDDLEGCVSRLSEDSPSAPVRISRLEGFGPDSARKVGLAIKSELFEDDDQEGIGSFRDSMKPDPGVHWNPSRCLAVTGAGGKQCNSWMTPICGNHEKSNSLVRVDEFPRSPNEELREELMDHCELDGKRAYAFAVLADDIEDIWYIVTGLEDVSVGPHDWSASQLAGWADKIAMHPEIDDEWSHPLAAKDCVAITGKGDQCPNGSYGTKLLCGLHSDVDDPDTVLRRNGILEDLLEVTIEGETHYVVAERGDDLVVVNPDWELERVPASSASVEPEEVEREDVGRDAEQAEAIEAIAHGAWDRWVIKEGFDLSGHVVDVLLEESGDVRDLFRWSNNLDSLEEWPGIGEKSSARIQGVLTELEARGVSQYTLLVDPEEDDEDELEVSGPTETISGPDDSISGPSDDEEAAEFETVDELVGDEPQETDDGDDDSCIIDDWLDDWDEETPPNRIDWSDREIPIGEWGQAGGDPEDDLLKTLEQIRSERDQLWDHIDRLEFDEDPDDARISKLINRITELEEEVERLEGQLETEREETKDLRKQVDDPVSKTVMRRRIVDQNERIEEAIDHLERGLETLPDEIPSGSFGDALAVLDGADLEVDA